MVNALTLNRATTHIHRVPERAGVSSAILRYHERLGLIIPTARTDAGYRLNHAAVMGRLGFIQRAKALGVSLREVLQLVREPTEPGPTRRDCVMRSRAS